MEMTAAYFVSHRTTLKAITHVAVEERECAWRDTETHKLTVLSVPHAEAAVSECVHV